MTRRCQTWGAYTGRRCELTQGHSGGHRLEVVTEPLTHEAEAQARPEQDEAVRDWTYLYDDYDAGTVFITDDPNGEQESIAEGLSEDIAKRIVTAHNLTLATPPPATPAALDDITIGDMQWILAKAMGCPLDDAFPACSHGGDAWEYSRHLIRDGYTFARLTTPEASDD